MLSLEARGGVGAGRLIDVIYEVLFLFLMGRYLHRKADKLCHFYSSVIVSFLTM